LEDDKELYDKERKTTTQATKTQAQKPIKKNTKTKIPQTNRYMDMSSLQSSHKW